ncbi:MAG: helix-turn-helix domain-containing protein [Halobacteriales archaeon]
MSDPGDPGASGQLSPADAFSVLGNETRLSILRALFRVSEPQTYAQLRRRVDPETAGNFNYHLQKLLGHFVRKDGDGYDLRRAGERVVRAVLAGTITEEPRLPPAPTDDRCVYCGGTVEMEYREASVVARCTECGGVSRDGVPEGTYLRLRLPPAGLRGRTREEVLEAAHVRFEAEIGSMANGVCPECGGRATVEFDVCEDHRRDDSGLCPRCDTRFAVWTNYECRQCRYARRASLWVTAMNLPAVVSFCHDHGLEELLPIRTFARENREFVADVSQAVTGTDPPRFRVTFPVGGDRLVVELDDAVSVTEVTVERDVT